MKWGIPCGQALRLRRIRDLEEIFEERMGELRGYLIKRGFKINEVNKQLQRARDVDRDSLFQRNSRRDVSNERVTLVLDFHPALSRIGRVIRNLCWILHASNDMKCIFQQPPGVSFQRVKNLKEELVRSRIRILDDGRKGMVKCGKSRCQISNFVEEGDVLRTIWEKEVMLVTIDLIVTPREYMEIAQPG